MARGAQAVPQGSEAPADREGRLLPLKSAPAGSVEEGATEDAVVTEEEAAADHQFVLSKWAENVHHCLKTPSSRVPQARAAPTPPGVISDRLASRGRRIICRILADD